jgi:hypothetical protein
MDRIVPQGPRALLFMRRVMTSSPLFCFAARHLRTGW